MEDFFSDATAFGGSMIVLRGRRGRAFRDLRGRSGDPGGPAREGPPDATPTGAGVGGARL